MSPLHLCCNSRTPKYHLQHSPTSPQCRLTFCSWICAFTTLYSADGGFWLEMSSSVSASQLSNGSRASWNFPQRSRASCSWAILWATCRHAAPSGMWDGGPAAPRAPGPSPSPHLLVEGVPAGVDLFHVMFQPLDITVLPGALDESLANSIHLLQL